MSWDVVSFWWLINWLLVIPADDASYAQMTHLHMQILNRTFEVTEFRKILCSHFSFFCKI